MDKVTYLTLEQILVIHEDQIERYGGNTGIRELSLLESAIFRPQSTFSGEDLYKNHFEKAAALMHSIIMNHAFVDGNKRTGTTSMLVYLGVNNLLLQVTTDELITIVLLIVKEKWTIEKIASWLENNTIDS